MDDMRALNELGRRLAKEQDEALLMTDTADEAVEEAERRLFSPRPKRRRTLPLVALAAAALAVVLLVWWQRARTPLTFELNGQPGLAQRWIVAEQETPLIFSDASSVVLRPGSRARVAALAAAGADMSLERGTAAISINPRSHARWRFSVGPYDVRVTGTRFDVSWKPAEEVFAIHMHQGSVELRGPTIAGMRTLVAGQSLEERPHSSAPAASSAATPPPATSAHPIATAQAVPSSSTPHAPPPPAWRELAAEGRYQDAWSAAELQFDNLLASGSIADLATVADVARYAGQPGQASRAYRALRARHPGTPQAARAAFSLGQMSFGGNQAAAVPWFERYLTEAPGGPLAREALGRILEAQQGSAAGRATARRYLQSYPQGPHAELARSMLNDHDAAP